MYLDYTPFCYLCELVIDRYIFRVENKVETKIDLFLTVEYWLMEENRRKLTLIALAGALVLLVMTGYPIVKAKVREYRQKDISLESELPSESVRGTEEEKAQKENDLSYGEKTSFSEGQGKEAPEIYLAVSGDGIAKNGVEIKVPLWLSEDGTGYFFFPGFAKGKKLRLEQMKGKSLWIGEKEIQKGDFLSDIREEEAYPLSWVSEDGKESYQIPVFFMYSSKLPTMFLSTASGSMEDIDSDKTYCEEGRVTLCGEEGEILYSGGVSEIGGRGNSTWGLSKKPYQLKLADEADFFGYGATRSWNLLANGYDETRLRNQITLDLARALGMDCVPDGKMIDLYINDSYYGNYYLTEKIEIGEGSVSIRDMEEVLNEIYDKEELGRLEILENEEKTRRWAHVSLEESDLSGGYLIERELPSRYQQETSGFATAQGDCYAIKSPAYASFEQVEYIAGLMQEFQDAVEEEDGIHPVTGKSYSEYIDMDSFVQKYLVEEISKNFDGAVTSSYFYKPEDEVSTRICAGPVWDYDVAFGNCNLDEIASNPLGITKLNNHVLGTDIFAHLYEKEDFYEKTVEMYRDRALPYLEYLLKEGIDKLVLLSRQSAKLDSIRWESLENRYQYYENYDNDVRYLKYFIEKRVDFLNQVWILGEVYHNITFMVEDEPWQIVCVKDGETGGEEPVPYRHETVSLFIGWVTKNGVPYDKYKPVYEDMVFYPIWQELGETPEE